jgi:hypothetical protein
LPVSWSTEFHLTYFSSSMSRVCGAPSMRLPVRPFPPVGIVAAPFRGALRFATFNGTMGSYDCSPTRPGRLRSPLATGTPRRGFVRFPWDTLLSLGTWFRSGWVEPHPAQGEVGSSPGFPGTPFESMPLASDSGDSVATSRYRLPGCCLPPGKRRRLSR